MSIVARLTWMEMKLFFREKQAVFWTFLFPVLMIWLFGSLFGDQKMPGGLSYSNMYVPSWIGVNLLTTALFTLGTTLVMYREKGILRRYQATPLRPWMVLGSHMIYGACIFLVSAFVLTVFGWAFYDLEAPKYPGSVGAALLLSVLALFPFGLFVTSLARDNRTASAISSVLLNLMLFLSGATFPLEMMPSYLQKAAKILPLYYVVELLRGTWNKAPLSNYGGHVAVLAAIAIVSGILATRFFRWGD